MNDITPYLNQVICGDNVSILRQFPDESIDLIVTSPPYDNLRLYKGYSFNFEGVANELYRITKRGGVVVWIVGDATIKGSETGTSFKQALYFMSIGFRLHDTMIYTKENPVPNAKTRYQQSFEYMFVFSREKPKRTNILTRPRRNKCNDKRTYRKKKFSRNNDGLFDARDHFINEIVPRENIWSYLVGGGNSTKDKIAFNHPAVFPEKLAHDHIISWSNENDIVLDPFVGSGTTCKMAKLLNRNYIGIDISDEYCEIARKRIEAA